MFNANPPSFSTTTKEYDLTLISEVKQNPVLYDVNHQNFKRQELKHAIWKSVTYRVKKSTSDKAVNMVKNRWKSLRDTMVKEVRNNDKTHKKPWRYASAMQFIIPHLAESNPAKGNSKLRKKQLDDISDDPMNTYLVIADDSGQNDSDEDEIDTFFKGIAETVKKLSPENQLKVRRDIANIILDTNLWEIKESKDPSDDV